MAKTKKSGMNKHLAKFLQKTAYMSYGALRAPIGNAVEWIANKAGVGDKYRSIGIVDEVLLAGMGWGANKLGAYKVPFIKDLAKAPGVIEWARIGEVGASKVKNLFTGKTANAVYAESFK